MKSSFSGCRSQVAPLEGEKGDEPVSDGDETPRGTLGEAPGREAAKKGVGRKGRHPPTTGRARRGPLTRDGAWHVSPVLTDRGAGACLRSLRLL